MVGVAHDSSPSPVTLAQAAMRQPHANVNGVLSQMYQTAPSLSEIPHLTDIAARPGQWVRYVGLVQDIWDAEMYLAMCSTGESGILTELSAQINPESDAGVQLAERHPIYLVSVPGETDWARGVRRPNIRQPISSATSTPQGQHPEQQAKAQRKRTRDAADMDDAPSSGNANGSTTVTGIGAGEGGASIPTPTPMSRPTFTTPSGARPPLPVPRGTDKRARQGSSDLLHPTTSTPNPAGLLGLNTPDVRGATAVVAKLYTSSATTANNGGTDALAVETPSLNSVVEVVGILQDAPVLPSTDSNGDIGFASEQSARNPRNVRRIHVVQWRILPEHISNPILARSGAIDNMTAARADAASNAARIRSGILEILRRVLYNDVLAAEYMLMALLARPIRADSQVLGKLSVNIVMPTKPTSTSSNPSPPPSSLGADGANISKVLRLLCPRVVDIDVNIASMNCADVYARKDYELNRLRAGRLQIAPGTCVMIDETRLTDGQLSERGVKNVHALRMLASRAVTPVDFQYYETNMDVSGSVVLVSQGGKSIVGGDVLVRVQHQENDNNNTGQAQPSLNLNDVSEEQLDQMRLGLTLLAEDGKFDISKEATEDISQVYVDARKAGRAKDGQESLQRWLCVARCAARSFGESSLSLERWRYALSLEQSRESRLSSK